MRRLVPTILALLAVVGLLVPPTPIVHAHEDGHDDHAHGRTHGFHVPILPDGGVRADDGHAHPHPHDPATPDGESPEEHAHASNAVDGLARARGAGHATADGAERSFMLLPACVGWASNRAAASNGPARALDDPDPQRGAGRALDALVALGRLLL